MIVTTPGKITDGLYLLGNVGYPSFLVNAARPAMFDAGVSPMGRSYLEDLIPLLSSGPVQHIFFTHSHYDHTGAYGYLKRHFPALQAGAHPRVSKVMQSASAVRTMVELSNRARDLFGDTTEETAFVTPEMSITLEDGDVIDLGGGFTATVLETPGHTRDSITFYLEPLGAVIPGEALGVAQPNGEIFPEFLTDYESYLSSARRIIEMKPEMILMPHGYSLTGSDARNFLNRVIPAAHSWSEMIATALERNGSDIDLTTRDLFDRLYDPRKVGQEVNAFRINLRAKVSCIARIAESEN